MQFRAQGDLCCDVAPPVRQFCQLVEDQSMNRTNVIAAALSLLFTVNLNAQEEPSPEEQDPTFPNKSEVVCGATASFISKEFGATRDSSTGNRFKLRPVGNRLSADKRAVTSGVITLERGHEFTIQLTWIPKGSNLVRGEDLMNATFRYQRRESNGSVKVLAESIVSSDHLTNFGELQSRRIDLSLRSNFINPEVSTIKMNKGNVPDGMTSNGTIECSMKVGKATDLR